MSSNETPTIKPTTDGPYIVKSLQRFSNQKGAIDTKDSMALCR